MSVPFYEITRIDGNSRDYANLIALCPACFQAYALGHKKAEARALKMNKDVQARSADARQLLSTADIERGITKVIEKLGNAKYTDFEPLEFEPVAVKDKIDEHTDFFIYDEVVTHVTRFYRFIEQQMQEEVRLKTFDDTLLRAQIKALARKLIDKGYPKMRIHSDLTDRLSQITKQDQRYCAYVVSCFVQSCEVFDAAS
ncbi:ABC-three component system protein [Arcanobacterium canis]